MKLKKPTYTRKQFLQTGAWLVGGSCMLLSCNRNGPDAGYLSWNVLSEKETTLVEMICNQIIPDDEDPGAVKGGVVNYINKQLLKGGRLEASLQDYKAGLKSLQETSQNLHTKPFEELSREEQTRLLQLLEKDEVEPSFWEQQKASAFFTMIRKHTIEGYFGHPRHGGNRNFAGYRLVGYEFPELKGQNRYTDARFLKKEQP